MCLTGKKTSICGCVKHNECMITEKHDMSLSALGISTFVDTYCSPYGVFKIGGQFILTQVSIVLYLCGGVFMLHYDMHT